LEVKQGYFFQADQKVFQAFTKVVRIAEKIGNCSHQDFVKNKMKDKRKKSDRVNQDMGEIWGIFIEIRDKRSKF